MRPVTSNKSYVHKTSSKPIITLLFPQCSRKWSKTSSLLLLQVPLTVFAVRMRVKCYSQWSRPPNLVWSTVKLWKFDGQDLDCGRSCDYRAYASDPPLSFKVSTMKERPCHVCIDLMPLKQELDKQYHTTKLTEASKSCPDVQTTLWRAPSQSPWAWCSSNVSASMKHNMKFVTSDMHSAWGCASQTPQVCNESLAPGWALIWVNFDPVQKIEPKVGGGHSFKGGGLSQVFGDYVHTTHSVN